MSYKVKSVLYFFSLLAAITIYYSMDNEIQFDAMEESTNLTSINIENASSTNAELTVLK